MVEQWLSPMLHRNCRVVQTVSGSRFDLEAPGLSSFAFNADEQEANEVPGLVDFVHHWLEFERAPDIREFVCKHTDDDPSHGPIFVMPAGKMDDAYGSRLHQIDFDLFGSLPGWLSSV